MRGLNRMVGPGGVEPPSRGYKPRALTVELRACAYLKGLREYCVLSMSFQVFQSRA